jgi:hypothetical protein
MILAAVCVSQVRAGNRLHSQRSCGRMEGRMTYRTRAARFVPRGLAGYQAEQVKDIGQTGASTATMRPVC